MYLFYCALMYVLLYINVHTTSPLVIVTANHISPPCLMYVLLYINVHTTSPLVIVTTNHISAPPGFPHPAALGIRIVRLPTICTPLSELKFCRQLHSSALCYKYYVTFAGRRDLLSVVEDLIMLYCNATIGPRSICHVWRTCSKVTRSIYLCMSMYVSSD